VEVANAGEVPAQGFDQALRQDRDSIPAGLAISDEDLAKGKVDVLDAKADAL
jgi:hypothetical protein